MSSDMSKLLDLTFGIELEFIVKYDPAYITEEKRMTALVYGKEDAKSVPSKYGSYALSGSDENKVDVFNENACGGTEREDFPTPSFIIDTQIFLALKAANILVESPCATDDLPEGKGDNGFWVMTPDYSISALAEHQNDPNSKYRCLELRSRVLSGTPKNLHASLKEVRQVLEVLHSMPFEILTNRTTGLHVHVGNERRGFPLRTLKNLGQMVYGFINAIQSIHPDHRIFANSYCWAMTRHLDPARGLAANLELIEEAPTQATFANRVSYSRTKSDAYYYGNLEYGTERMITWKPKYTIEFRQHAGSIDADAVCSWVEVATGLIQWCHDFDGSVMPLVLRHGSKANFMLPDLLKLIEKEHLNAFYTGKLYLDRPLICFGKPAKEKSG